MKQPTITNLAEFLGSTNKMVMVGNKPISKTIMAGKAVEAIMARKINNKPFLANERDLKDFLKSVFFFLVIFFIGISIVSG